MNIEYSKLNDVEGLITIEANEQDFTEAIEKQLKKIRQTRTEPGFRPGQVPMGMIRKKYGKYARYEAIENQVGHALMEFIQKEQLRVLGQPMLDEEALPNFDEAEMVFKYKVGLAPEIQVNVDALEIPYYTIKVTEEMINKQDESLRSRFGKQVPGETVEPNAVVKGKLTQLDADGNPMENGLIVEDGILSPQYFHSDEQKALFIGKNVGAPVVFNPWATCDGNPVELSSMLHVEKAQIDNYKGDFRMDISEIIVLKKAEPGQEYYDEVFGADKVHNEEEYRTALKDMIAGQLSADSNYRFSIDARQAVENQIGDVQLPDAILTRYLAGQKEDTTPEKAAEEYAAMRPGLIWRMTFDAIANQLDIKIDDDDLRNIAIAATRQRFAQYGMTNVPNEVIAKYAQEMVNDRQTRDSLEGQALENKVMNAIRAKAHVQEMEVSVEQFNDLFKSPEAQSEEQPAEA